MFCLRHRKLHDYTFNTLCVENSIPDIGHTVTPIIFAFTTFPYPLHTHTHTHTTHTSFPFRGVSGRSSPCILCSESVNVYERVVSKCFYRHTTTYTLSLATPSNMKNIGSGELAMVKLCFTWHEILGVLTTVWVECCVYCEYLIHGS